MAESLERLGPDRRLRSARRLEGGRRLELGVGAETLLRGGGGEPDQPLKDAVVHVRQDGEGLERLALHLGEELRGQLRLLDGHRCEPPRRRDAGSCGHAADDGRVVDIPADSAVRQAK